jgi:hypothetical protein
MLIERAINAVPRTARIIPGEALRKEKDHSCPGMPALAAASETSSLSLPQHERCPDQS